ncbi:unnamed protein product [Prorocentrum cordatum]|uniref:AMP-dependent synthetase/ligase domain-containing protein n=1 Tax=Prorocentrum cordatum TaxID=2364126 RepID=A0ABN9X149_9DINO|nr:unnamed protein product [Polarella glacialis]
MAVASGAELARGILQGHAASGGVTALVAQQALRTPHSRALAAGPGSAVAYGELWAAAWRAASGLVRGGLRAGGHAAVFVDEGAGLVTTELAVWLAAGVVVPLDAAWPRERLLFLLADAAAEVATCGRAQRARLDGLAVPLLCHEDLQAAEPLPGSAGRPPTRADAVSHLIYTRSPLGGS